MNEGEIEREFENDLGNDFVLDKNENDPKHEDFLIFKKIYYNEKLAPQILPYETVLAHNIQRYINAQVSAYLI